MLKNVSMTYYKFKLFGYFTTCFPLQSSQGLGPKNLHGVKTPAKFQLDRPRDHGSNPTLALGTAAGPLGEALDLH